MARASTASSATSARGPGYALGHTCCATRTQRRCSARSSEAATSTAWSRWCSCSISSGIRTAKGRDSRTQRDAKQSALRAERGKARALREEVAGLKLDVRRLASINETLAAENASLRAQVASPKVQQLDTRRAGKEPR